MRLDLSFTFDSLNELYAMLMTTAAQIGGAARSPLTADAVQPSMQSLLDKLTVQAAAMDMDVKLVPRGIPAVTNGHGATPQAPPQEPFDIFAVDTPAEEASPPPAAPIGVTGKPIQPASAKRTERRRQQRAATSGTTTTPDAEDQSGDAEDGDDDVAEKAAAPEPAPATASSPEGLRNAAVTLLEGVWKRHPAARDDILALAKELGVARLGEVPATKIGAFWNKATTLASKHGFPASP